MSSNTEFVKGFSASNEEELANKINKYAMLEKLSIKSASFAYASNVSSLFCCKALVVFEQKEGL